LKEICAGALKDDLPYRKIWKVQCQTDEENEQQPPDASRKRRPPVMILDPALPRGDDEREPCPEQKRRRAQAVNKFVTADR